jgi:hypothetical protein
VGEMFQTSLEVHAGRAVYRFGIHPVMEIGNGENRDPNYPRRIEESQNGWKQSK